MGKTNCRSIGLGVEKKSKTSFKGKTQLSRREQQPIGSCTDSQGSKKPDVNVHGQKPNQ